MNKALVIKTLAQIQTWLSRRKPEDSSEPNALEAELLRELINSGTIKGVPLTNRDLVTPRVKTLLDQGRYDELQGFLETYVARLNDKHD